MSYKVGLLAEYLVGLYYMLKMHKILAHRYKTYVGEIDLILIRKKCIIFVEVKGRKGGIYEGIVSQTQLSRIKRAAELFLVKNAKYKDYDLRFDLAIVQPYKMPMVIKNAW